MQKIISKITLNSVAFLITFCAIVFGVFTYIKFLSSDYLLSDIKTVYVLMVIELLLLISLAFIFLYKISFILREKKKKRAGAKLQSRLIKIFTAILTIPFLVICISYVFSSYLGMQTWFSDRVKQAVNESVYVSEAYLIEHKSIIKTDVLNLENMINEISMQTYNDKSNFSGILRKYANSMGLSEIIVFDGSNRVIAETEMLPSLEFDVFKNIEEMNLARNGEIVIMHKDNEESISSLKKLDGLIDSFVLVSKFVDTNILQHVEISKKGAENYFHLEKNMSKIQFTFILVFAMLSLVLLFLSIMLSFVFTDRITSPIIDLIKASRKVGEGNFNINICESKNSGEINDLIKAFNLMTKKLEEQQQDLIKANQDLDERKQFIESVLSGVPSGVMGISNDLIINLANPEAEHILDIKKKSLINKNIDSIFPNVRKMIENNVSSKQIEISFDNQPHKILSINITKQEKQGFVISFRDITSLIYAQKQAAWGDVAKRIAHEIKNPLTPISISTERIKRKFKDEVKDKEVFNTCTDTILRQVKTIRQMINEFSSFSRMPEPVFKENNLSLLVKNATLAFKTDDISISFRGFSKDVMCYCDEMQIIQAISNIVKNSIEAMHEVVDKKLVVSINKSEDNIKITIEDNGSGIDMDKDIIEPYVTTKDKGTGLGLAIVKKIMEDHLGTISFYNKRSRGAKVTLCFKCRRINNV
ncbi:MAG: ATP-binding protein [Alphaproteobacteria bacterium]|nr:ATP-binding protein [Alphaproteobacteria bacterium]